MTQQAHKTKAKNMQHQTQVDVPPGEFHSTNKHNHNKDTHITKFGSLCFDDKKHHM